MNLTNKTVVVTGAGNGIGKALCSSLAEAGAKVVIADIEVEAAHAVKAELDAQGYECLAVHVDVSDASSVTTMRDAAVTAFGGVDILVNNAGVMHSTQPLHETTSDDLEWVFSVNVGGVMNGIRSFVPLFIEQGTPAWILNTASEHSLGVPHVGGGGSGGGRGMLGPNARGGADHQPRPVARLDGLGGEACGGGGDADRARVDHECGGQVGPCRMGRDRL